MVAIVYFQYYSNVSICKWGKSFKGGREKLINLFVIIVTLLYKIRYGFYCQEILLPRNEHEGENFVEFIFTTKWTWVSYITLETERASMQCLSLSAKTFKKAKNTLYVGRIMTTFCCYKQSILYLDFYETRTTASLHFRPCF